MAESHPRQSLPELEQGGKKQHTAWGITMSSVSLESKKQGRESKVEARELTGLDHRWLGAWGYPVGLGEPGTNFKHRQIMFDRGFSDASWEMCVWWRVGGTSDSWATS